MRAAFERLLIPSALLALAACASSTSSSSGETGSEQDVTGVTDLTDMESELSLVKDSKDAQGNWSRPEDKLAAGPCYARLLGGPDGGGGFEFRRYRNGAAFFAKKGTAPATGDTRPVLCVDVDVTDLQGTQRTLDLSGLSLDSVVRYHLGQPRGSEGAAGSEFESYERGLVSVRESDNFCRFFGPTGTANDAMDACRSAYDAELAADTIDRPAYLASGVDYELLSLSAALGGGDDPTAQMVSLVHRYAHATAKGADSYSFANDPVGKAVHLTALRATYEKVDVEEFEDADVQHVVIVSPGGDPRNFASALAHCSRTVSLDHNGKFTCTGI